MDGFQTGFVTYIAPVLLFRIEIAIQGLIQGGSGPPPPFLGTPKLYKEGENVVPVHANTPRFSHPDPPLRNPVSAPRLLD